MSPSDMDDDLALAALLGRGPRDADETALGGVLASVARLSEGPAPAPSSGLAAFLAAQNAAPVAEAAPAVVPAHRSRRSLVRRLVPAGVAAKVVLGAAGVAVAGTTSLGAVALVGDDDLPPRRPAVVEPAPAVAPAARTSSGDDVARERPTAVTPTPAVDAHSDGRGRDDERAAVQGGGTREPQAERGPARPERPVRETSRPKRTVDEERTERPEGRTRQGADSRPTGGPSETRPEPAPSTLEDTRQPAVTGMERRRAPAPPNERAPAQPDESVPADE